MVKICHNLLLGVVTQTMAEITVLAEAGVVFSGPTTGWKSRCPLRRTWADEGRPDDALDLVRELVDAGMSVADLHDHVLLPAQREVGRMWLLGETPIAFLKSLLNCDGSS